MLKSLKRFPLVAILVLATALSACGEDDPSDPNDDDDDNPVGTTTVTFTYDPADAPNAPEITAVAVPGQFNTNPGEWSPTDPGFQMEEQSDGSWELTVELAPGTYEYKYHFNGDTWASNMCDDAVFGDVDGEVSPQNEGCTGGFGNATITVVSDDE